MMMIKRGKALLAPRTTHPLPNSHAIVIIAYANNTHHPHPPFCPPQDTHKSLCGCSAPHPCHDLPPQTTHRVGLDLTDSVRVFDDNYQQQQRQLQSMKMDISPLTGVCFAGCKIIHLGGSSSATTHQTTLLVAVLMKRIIPDHWDLIIQSTPNCISPRLVCHTRVEAVFFSGVLIWLVTKMTYPASSHLTVSPQVMLFLSAVVSSWIHHLSNIPRKKRINKIRNLHFVSLQ